MNFQVVDNSGSITRRAGGKTSQNAELIAALGNLPEGKAIQLVVPTDVDFAKYRNNLSTSLRKPGQKFNVSVQSDASRRLIQIVRVAAKPAASSNVTAAPTQSPAAA